jgi:hypothetical protein
MPGDNTYSNIDDSDFPSTRRAFLKIGWDFISTCHLQHQYHQPTFNDWSYVKVKYNQYVVSASVTAATSIPYLNFIE